MFNTIHNHTNPSHVHSSSTVSVTEKRAPTDESIKIFDEMLDKARKSHIKRLTIDNNVLKDVTIDIFKDMAVQQHTVYWQMELNGRKICNKFGIQQDDIDNSNEYVTSSVVAQIVKVVLKDVSNELTRTLLCTQ